MKLLVSGIVNTLRWLGYAWWLNPYTLVLLSFLHGGSFMLLYLCLAEYVHRHIRKELKASGQMMNFIVLNGVGRVVGALFGGIGVQYIGFSTVFVIVGAISLVGVIPFAFFTRSEQIDRNGGQSI